MGFLTPKPSNDDERLPGAAGLHLDVDPQRCPSCRREVAPWDARCRDCGEEPVPSSQLPGEQVSLPPGLQAMADDLDAELAADRDTERDTEDQAGGEAGDGGGAPTDGHGGSHR